MLKDDYQSPYITDGLTDNSIEQYASAESDYTEQPTAPMQMSNATSATSLMANPTPPFIDLANYLPPYYDPSDPGSHTRAFQAAIEDAKQCDNSSATIVWGAIPGGIILTDTVYIDPFSTDPIYANRTEVHISMSGNGNIIYRGPANKPVFSVVGLRNVEIRGVQVGVDGLPNSSRHSVYVWDIDTRGAGDPVDRVPTQTYSNDIGSTSGITFKNCGTGLGNGINNTGFRLGHKSGGGGGDISNIRWENCIMFGFLDGSKVQPGQPKGAEYTRKGQTGIRFEGRNTLSNVIQSGLIAYMDRGITTLTRAYRFDPNNPDLTLDTPIFYQSGLEYGSEVRLNGQGWYEPINGAGGIVCESALVFSHNRIDCLFPSIQSLQFSNTRHEDSLMILDVSDSTDGGIIKFDGCQIDNCRGVAYYLYLADNPDNPSPAPDPNPDKNKYRIDDNRVGTVMYLARPSTLRLQDCRIGKGKEDENDSDVYGNRSYFNPNFFTKVVKAVQPGFAPYPPTVIIDGGLVGATDPLGLLVDKTNSANTNVKAEVHAVQRLAAGGLPSGQYFTERDDF